MPTAELVRAVRVIADGDALLSPAVTRRLLDRVGRRLPASATTAPAALAELTDREREVFELLARGLSNAEIAEVLTVGDATVKTHVSNVLMKLGLRDRVQAVVLAYESGLIAPGTSPDGGARGADPPPAGAQLQPPCRRQGAAGAGDSLP